MVLFVGSLLLSPAASADSSNQIWEVRSIDTMKLSRDEARKRRNDKAFDAVIEQQVTEIKGLGANYIALGTPYDEEFLPYLHRWVNAARKQGLKIWYRGSFSGYEGWFEYPKTVGPEELLSKSQTFIEENPDLFEDGDIFDACPECENMGHWPQPQADSEYNAFIQRKNQVLSEAFEDIDKDVNVNYPSIIGGRAKEVITIPTAQALGKVITIDHYNPDPQDYLRYIDHFWNLDQTKVLFGEFGAPIPDMHGSMTPEEQAAFVKQVFEVLYQKRSQVVGLNYWVYSHGTTALVDTQGVNQPVTEVIQDYFRPGSFYGRVSNTAGISLPNTLVTVQGLTEVTTTDGGLFDMTLPAGSYKVAITHPDYISQEMKFELQRDQRLSQEFILVPQKKTWWYSIREFMHLKGF